MRVNTFSALLKNSAFQKCCIIHYQYDFYICLPLSLILQVIHAFVEAHRLHVKNVVFTPLKCVIMRSGNAIEITLFLEVKNA